MMQVVDVWKKFSHPNCVALREVFTTKAFGDNSLILVYDLQPGEHDEFFKSLQKIIFFHRRITHFPIEILYAHEH